MKIGQTAKQIDNLLTDNGNRYARNFGNYMGTCTTWNDKRSTWNKDGIKYDVVKKEYVKI